MSSLPTDWSVNYSDTEDNSIEISSLDESHVGSYSLDFTAVIGNNLEQRALVLNFEIINCEYEKVYTQAEFVSSPSTLELTAQSFLEFVQFPSFQMRAGSHESCGVVTQTIDLDDAPSGWSVTFSESSENEITLTTLDESSVGSYSFSYEAYILDNRDTQSLTVMFDIELSDGYAQ